MTTIKIEQNQQKSHETIHHPNVAQSLPYSLVATLKLCMEH